jgi:hypothetical protein
VRVCGLTLQIMDDDAVKFVPSMVGGKHIVTMRPATASPGIYSGDRARQDGTSS